jgi:hypothetical protein
MPFSLLVFAIIWHDLSQNFADKTHLRNRLWVMRIFILQFKQARPQKGKEARLGPSARDYARAVLFMLLLAACPVSFVVGWRVLGCAPVGHTPFYGAG